jgi:transcriptional regulator with XRE-family HTH domain
MTNLTPNAHLQCNITESGIILLGMGYVFEGFGHRLRCLREQRGINQEQLRLALKATRFSVKISRPNHISNMETSDGRKLPSVQVLAALAEVLETNTDYLLGLTDDPAPHSDLEDQVVFGTRNESEHRRLREAGKDFLSLPSDDQELALAFIRRLKPKPPRIIGDEE